MSDELIGNLRNTLLLAQKSRTNIELKPDELSYLFEWLDMNANLNAKLIVDMGRVGLEKDALQKKLDDLLVARVADQAEYESQLDAFRVALRDEVTRGLFLQEKLDIAIEGLEEIYNTHEHIPNKYAQGAAKIAAKTLGRLK